MKKFNKYTSLAVVALMGAGWLSSCDDSKNNDFVQEYEGQPTVYFSVTANSYLELDENSNTVSYPVYREVAGAAQTVNISVTPVDDYEVTDIYTFPSSVTFEAGSREALFTIGYDITKAEIGDEQQYELVLENVQETPFAPDNVVITLVNPIPWIRLGSSNQYGQYYDYFWGVTLDSTGPVQVEVYQSAIDKNEYRLSNPYIALNDDETATYRFRVLQEGETYLGQVVPETGLVGFNTWYCEYYTDYNDDLYFCFPGIFNNYNDPQYWQYCRVIEFQEDGVTPGYIQLAGLYYMFNTGGFNYWNQPSVEIFFPGFVLLDTNLEASYEGVLTPTSQLQQVLLNVELGQDITSARAGVMAGEDADALVAAIENDQVAYTTFSESGNVKIDFGNDNETGTYTWAVVAYVEDDVKNVITGKFFYISSSSDYNPNEGWTSLGYVEYTDGYMSSQPMYIFDMDWYLTYDVEIQESTDVKGLYRLVNPYGEAYPYNEPGDWDDTVNSYLYINASDPNAVYIADSEQTLAWYGNGWSFLLNNCTSLIQQFMNDGATAEELQGSTLYGTVKDGKITFPNTFVFYDEEEDDYFWFAPLIANWTFPNIQGGYTGDFPANLLSDVNVFDETDGEDQYVMNDDGTYFGPFCVDLNSITSTRSAHVNTRSSLPSYNSAAPFQNTIKHGAKKVATVKQLRKMLGVNKIRRFDSSPVREPIVKR
ncbi:MAG: hypothetical protein J1F67_05835 [Muribaculaceae bacterium]|nr:hypothetical protein [Muribaculaceae bacterium]